MRVIAGPEKKTRVMSDKERRITAYHEMGHAIVGHYLPNADPIHKISVISRGQALGLHDLAARRGQVPDHARGAARHDGDDARRPRRRGDHLRRGDDRRVERPREGHRDRQADGDAVRDVREARAARVRPRSRACRSSAASSRAEPDYSDEIAREIDDEIRRIVESAHVQAKELLTEHRASLEKLSEILSSARRSRRSSSRRCSPGGTEEEVFGAEAPPPPEVPIPPATPERAGREGPRPLPRPGLAGGTAE